MALVKKGPFFMAFYGHKTLISISYHFYGFLWLRTNPDEQWLCRELFSFY